MNKKEKFNCNYCGKEIWREVGYKCEHHFCNQECQYAYLHEHYNYIVKNCEMCGKEMKLDKKHKKQRFCSNECRSKWYGNTHSGKNGGRYNSIVGKCHYCGNDIYISKYRRDNFKYLFCNKECQSKWFAESFSQSKEWKSKMSQTIVQTMSEGKIASTMTKPHRKVCELLDSICIKYQCEYPVEYYSVDICLIEHSLMIEIMGDYWHSNPTTKHFNNIDAKRKDIIRRDRSKHSFIKNRYNTEVLYLWETDINQNADLCIGLIKKYIECNGHLDNYDSFNYYIDGDDVVVNDVIIDSNITTNKEI